MGIEFLNSVYIMNINIKRSSRDLACSDYSATVPLRGLRC